MDDLGCLTVILAAPVQGLNAPVRARFLASPHFAAVADCIPLGSRQRPTSRDLYESMTL